MKQVFQYMRFAQECRIMAAKEQDGARKAELIKLSEKYETLAVEREVFIKQQSGETKL